MAGAFRPSEDKERVREASDIVRVIGEHVALKPRGREFVGLCPFHDDHKPSMWVSPAKGIYKCFSCGAGGDVFTFVQNYHSMEFRDALEHLAQRAGIELTRHKPQHASTSSSDHAPEVDRKALLRANATALDFFRAILSHPEHGQAARDTIARRQIAPEMVERFALGAAPDRWDGLLLKLQKQGIDTAPFAAAGLLKRRDTGTGLYDALRHRLIFPIHDQLGRVIAFGGRKLRDEDEPKYLNSPESPLFDKSATLYGLHQAARDIQKARLAIITEGYTDTIACHQAGFTNALATLGTALTPKHAAILRRLCSTVVLLFDSDEAGLRAADRAVEVFFAEELDVKIATLAGHTDAKDPDELLKLPGGADVLRTAIDRATDVLAFRYARMRQRLAGRGLSDLNRAISEELDRLVQLGLADLPVLRRTLIIKQVAAVAGVDERTIVASLPGRSRPRQPAPGADLEPKPLPDVAASNASRRARALGALLAEPAAWAALTDRDREELDPIHFEPGPMRDLAHAMFDVAAHAGSCAITDLVRAVEDTLVHSLATDLAIRHEMLFEGDPARAARYLRDCLASINAAESPLSLADARRLRAAQGDNRRALPRPAPPGASPAPP